MRFYVFSPPFNSKSAGVSILFELPELLSFYGFDVSRVLIAQNPTGDDFISFDEHNFVPLTKGTITANIPVSGSIIIHGETLDHRFFDDHNVARFYLNRIGALRNKGKPRDGEFKIAFHKSFVDNYDYLLSKDFVKTTVEEIPHIENRSLDVTYVGKGDIYLSESGRIPRTIELTRSWPESDEEYVYLLSNTRYLFSFDTVTSVMSDAIYYGAMPIFMTFRPFGSETEFRDAFSESHPSCPLLLIDEFKSIKNRNKLCDFEVNFQKYVVEFRQRVEQSNLLYRAEIPGLAMALLEFFE